MTNSPTTSDDLDIRALRAVLDAVAHDTRLLNGFVVKGGLALQLLYGSPRTSRDLDFNALLPTANEITPETNAKLDDFSERLTRELEPAASRSGLSSLTISREEKSDEIPTLLAEIAYESRSSADGVVKFQLTLSEIICASEMRTYNGIPIHVASLEDILAEKLKALLQQAARDTVRSVDVFDIWYFSRLAHDEVDPGLITQFMLEKRKQWPEMPPLEKREFRRQSVASHASEEYEEIRYLLPEQFELVPFQNAFEGILEFVERLDLPD